MALQSSLAKLVAWLRPRTSRAAPWHGGIPLLALRGRELTDDDVTLIAGELAFSANPQSEEEIRKAIKAITRLSVGDTDVAKVRARLARGR
jgi:hypothetical protein